MALSILTNVASLNAQRNLAETQRTMDSSLSRLSSGMRITKASDDAAGLAVSETLRAQVRGLQQASRNAQDGISVIQIAEGAMNEITNMMIRMRELAVQSASDGISDTERGYLNTEVSALADEIDRIAGSTAFAGNNLIDGSGADMDFQVGIDSTANSQVTVSFSALDVTAATLGVDQLSMTVDSKANALLAIDAVDTALDTVASNRATLGSVANRLVSTINNLAVSIENVAAANSRIRDVDVAEESSRMTRAQILMQAGVSVLAQANAAPQYALALLGR
ncbi:MAG: flagellin [Pseudomonadota bacterium]